MRQTAAVVTAVLLSAVPAAAEDVLTVKTIGMDLARDIANLSVKACVEKGYQASAVVVDRNGDIMAAIRSDLASRFTLEIAERKAKTVILSGADSGQIRASREDIRQELNHISGIIIMQGGVQIVAGGNRVGAVGVSGAPGGDIDEACARAAMEKLFDRIEFAK
ncbi:MAG: heme-binding protein [Proteobacteria bacterium]|nr:heme-binding protein [Pseudomonadota bacterium]